MNSKKPLRILLGVIGVTAIVLVVIFFISKKTDTTQQSKTPRVIVAAHRLSFDVEVVKDAASQAQGLSNRDTLAVGSGMLFAFPQKQESIVFWMNEMKFPLDIVWISDNLVIGVERAVLAPKAGDEPERRKSPAAVDYVLEVNAGEAASIIAGDHVTFENL